MSRTLKNLHSYYQYGIEADDYITKPYDPEELQAKVRILLRLKNAQDHKGTDLFMNSKRALTMLFEDGLRLVLTGGVDF